MIRPGPDFSDVTASSQLTRLLSPSLIIDHRFPPPPPPTHTLQPQVSPGGKTCRSVTPVKRRPITGTGTGAAGHLSTVRYAVQHRRRRRHRRRHRRSLLLITDLYNGTYSRAGRPAWLLSRWSQQPSPTTAGLSGLPRITARSDIQLACGMECKCNSVACKSLASGES